jgi:D-sedoheptulose 7-phosphate isomerase
MADSYAHSTESDARADYVRALLRRSIAVKERLISDHAPTVVRMADICVEAIASGGKLLLCGNGGSAADAQHLAAELLVRLRPEVNRAGVPALTLALDSSSMTACGNDYSYDGFFERMLRALGRPQDVLLAITTSGKSTNVLRALIAAGEMKITTLGLLGGDGGPALQYCDIGLIVPSTETGRIQESHITIGHALMELIEEGLLASGALARV